MTFFTFIKIIFRRFFWYILVFVILALATFGYFFTSDILYQSSDSLKDGEAKALTERVSLIAFLPEGEVPTVAKVSNPELLKDQIFFKDAKRGDVVLIYSATKKAILYDPTANKIVNISTLNMGSVKKTNPTLPSLQTGEPTTPDPNIQNQF